MTVALEKVLYTAKATATGGREGHSKTEDGMIDLTMTPPKEMGGAGTGANPEQLFAAGYAACFLGAVKFSGRQQQVAVSDDATVTAAVSIGPITGGFGLAVELTVSLPGIDKDTAQKLVDQAHNEVCPYSNATRGNVDVTITLA
jgi:osmotically inducible protein OsmC